MDLALEEVDSQGKLQPNEKWPVFVDWSNNFDKQTAGQAILIYVLKQFVELAKVQANEDAAKYQRLIEKYSNFAQKQLFDKTKGFFVSGSKQEINIASQVWMVLAHVLTDEQNKQLMTNGIKRFFPVTGIATPYMYHHIAEALFESEHQKEGIQLIKNYWGKMIQLGADTFWEAFKPEDLHFSPYGSPIINSYCHAWSCTPTHLIRKYLINE